MKNLLFLFGIIFSGNIYTVRTKLSEGDKEVLKELYSASKSYSNLSSEVRSLVDKFLWNSITLENGNTYRLFLCSKGKGREDQLSLRCKVCVEGKNSLRSIPELIGSDKDFAYLVKSQNSNYLSNQDSMNLLLAQQENKAFYKKLADGLEVHKAKKNYIDYLKNQKQVSSKYIDAWKNYALLSSTFTAKHSTKIPSNSNTTFQSATKTFSTSAKPIAASSAPFVKSALKSKKIIPAMALAGAAGLAYNYFKIKDENEDKEKTSIEVINNLFEDNLESSMKDNDQDKNLHKNDFSYMSQFSKFCTSNPGKVASAAVITGALVYGAYKLYESDFFAESKSKKLANK